ncbi:Hypothetical predicted protein [Olea europaea subsp. europaea]|uniref:Uncharacterized protein n=1 Tax=Olea europaea subsp. europaea TaxID=158383 RepID=A0A8S0R9R1_OLEEU|nr:Hypothetical predicted protein [Olea europaea subsp. europaea]
MDARVLHNPQIAQTHQDASMHVPITANNPENQDLRPISESANSQSTKPIFDDGGGTHDRRRPPKDTTYHDTSTEHMGLPQFGLEITVRPEIVNTYKNRSNSLSIGIPP